MRSLISRITLTLMCLLLGGLALFALDLPTTTINGREYFYYKVNKNETVYGISQKLGISREDIVRCNPQARDGVHKKQVLYFPVDEFGTMNVVNGTAQDANTDAAVAAPLKRALISVPLIIDASASELPRAQKLTVDFYRGFLLGADTLCSRGRMVEIEACDFNSAAAMTDSAALAQIMAAATVVVAPNDDEALNSLAAQAPAQQTYVLNIFSVRDTSYMHNPYVLQANIPQALMYEKAAAWFLNHYEGCLPVILKNTSGRNEKESFTQYLEERLARVGTGCIKVEYAGNLTRSDLTQAGITDSTAVVFVPGSGTLAEFNRFAAVIKNFRDARLAVAVGEDGSGTPEPVYVFGYPDWVAFRGDAEEMLHSLGAVIYSRFYDNWTSFQSRNIDAAFRRWYGESMMESVPSQGLLGHDTACYLIKNLRAHNGRFVPQTGREFNGIQSSFNFEKVSADGGYVNTALFIIKFLAQGQSSAQVL